MKTVINATHIDHHGQRTSCELTVDHDVTGRVAELLARGMLAEIGMFPPKPAGEVVITVDEHRDGGDSAVPSMRVHELADALGVGSGTLRDYLGAKSVMTRLSDLVSRIAASDGVERSQPAGGNEAARILLGLAVDAFDTEPPRPWHVLRRDDGWLIYDSDGDDIGTLPLHLDAEGFVAWVNSLGAPIVPAGYESASTVITNARDVQLRRLLVAEHNRQPVAVTLWCVDGETSMLEGVPHIDGDNLVQLRPADALHVDSDAPWCSVMGRPERGMPTIVDVQHVPESSELTIDTARSFAGHLFTLLAEFTGNGSWSARNITDWAVMAREGLAGQVVEAIKTAVERTNDPSNPNRVQVQDTHPGYPTAAVDGRTRIAHDLRDLGFTSAAWTNDDTHHAITLSATDGAALCDQLRRSTCDTSRDATGRFDKVAELSAWLGNNVDTDDLVAGEHAVDVALRLLGQHYRKPNKTEVALPDGWERLADDGDGPHISSGDGEHIALGEAVDPARGLLLVTKAYDGDSWSGVPLDAVRAFLALLDGPTEPLTGSFRHFASALFGAMAKHCRTSCDRFIGETTFERWAADAVSDSPSSRTAHDLIIEAKRRAGAGDTPVAVHDKPKRTRDDFPPGSLVRVLSVADDDDPPVGTVLRVSGLVAYNNDPFVRVFWGGDEHKHGEYPLHVSQIEPVAEKLERVNVVLGRGVPSDAGCYARTHIYGHGLAVNICGTGPGWMRKLAGQPNELTILIEDCDVKPGVDVLFVRELSIDGKTVGSPVDFDQWLAGLAVRQSGVSSKP